MANETLNTAMGSISAAVATVVFFGTVWKFLTDKYQFEDKLKEFNRRKEDLKRFRDGTETTIRNQLRRPGNVVRQNVQNWLDAAGVEISEEQSVEYLVKQKGILSLFYRTGIVKTRTAELNRTFENGEKIRQLPRLVNDDASLERFTEQKEKLKFKLREVKVRLMSQLLVPWKIEKGKVKLWRGKVEEITGQTATDIEIKFNGSVPQEPEFLNLVKEKIREMEELLSSGGALPPESLVVDDYSQTLGDGERQSFEEWKDKLQAKHGDVTEKLSTECCQNPEKIVAEQVEQWLQKVDIIIPAASDVHNQLNCGHPPYLAPLVNRVNKLIWEMKELCNEGDQLPESLVVDDYSLTLSDDDRKTFVECKEKLWGKYKDVGRILQSQLRPGKTEMEQVKIWKKQVEETTASATDVQNQLSNGPPYTAPLIGRVKKIIQKMEKLHIEGALLPEILVVDDYSQTLGDGERQSLVVSLQLLIAITNNFSEENILGRGGFATVYKGEFLDGKKVAVKRMKPGIVNERVLKDFTSEIEVVSTFQHCHLVGLLGYCIDGNERLLVYEYMPQGTLSRYLFKWKEEGLEPLEWTSRLRIALDVARGVEYLHILAQQSYIHRDIKSPNILLGDDMRAKVADFGFVRRAADGSVSVETRVIGTFGYFAPEYFESGRVTKKADVYSFGVVLMELITGRKAVGETIDEETFHLVTWFRKMLIQKDTFREAIDQSIDLNEDILASICTVAELAGLCSAKERDQRPRMSHVVNVLSSLAECWKPPVLNSDATHVPDFGMSLPEALENWRVVEGESIADITDAYDPCFTNGVTHAAASVANLNEDHLVEMVARSDLKDVLKACGQAVAEGDSPTAAGLYVKRTVQ